MKNMQSTSRRKAAPLAFLAIFGCGKAADPAPVSETRLPEGGRVSSRVFSSEVRQMVVDESGVLWMSSCEGVYAVQGSEVRRYAWPEAAIPKSTRDVQLLVDAQNRTWVFGPLESLHVIEGGAFHTVFEGRPEHFSVSGDGRVWVSSRERTPTRMRSWVQQVLPTLSDEIATPEYGVGSIAAGPDGSLWVGTDGGVYRWAEGSWSGPFSPDVNVLSYDPRRDVLLGSDANLTGTERLRWNGTEFDRRPLSPRGSSDGLGLGFDAEGRWITTQPDLMRWFADGELVEEAPLSGFSRHPLGAPAPGGSVYLASSTAITQLNGGELAEVVDVSRFNPYVEFPWRARAFGEILRDPSVEVTRAQLAAPEAEVIGSKLHFTGIAFGGFETAGIYAEGELVPNTGFDFAREVTAFMADRGLSASYDVSVSSDGQSLAGDEPLFDLYGYLEVGSCFSGSLSFPQQFWVVEGYPVDMPAAEREELAAAFRAQHPLPAPE